MKHPNIGAHVGAAGGLWKSVENAKAIGATCFQIFGASPRQWRANMPPETEIKKFKSTLKENGLGPVYLHAAYLVNLASGNKELLKKSVENLTAHLKIAEMLGAVGLIFHPGSWKGMKSKEEGLVQEVKAMQTILKNVPGASKCIIENTAGGGEKIGTLEDIRYLYAKVKSKRVQVCIDTAHAFESGMIREYATKEIKTFLNAWDVSVGLENIPVLHVNDSKTAGASHHDRHENIGEGYIGKEGFKALAKERSLWNKDWILEVPGFTNEGPDKKNIDILKSCFHA
ncbi:MAG: deoxyribonuclease IV [bacterium]|nr:deoxyribonuclease IV [bacterium]